MQKVIFLIFYVLFSFFPTSCHQKMKSSTEILWSLKKKTMMVALSISCLGGCSLSLVGISSIGVSIMSSIAKVSSIAMAITSIQKIGISLGLWLSIGLTLAIVSNMSPM